MGIKSGNKTFVRKNARNFTNKQAQQRLTETVKPFNKQVENALYVNSVDIDYYQKIELGKPCTCSQTEILPNMIPKESNVPPVITQHEDSKKTKIKLKSKSLFGHDTTERAGDVEFNVSGDNILSQLDDFVEEKKEDTDEGLFVDNPVSNSIDCGICYRTGILPGYTALGKQRFLLHVYDVVDVSGYNIETGVRPNEFRKQHPQGFVEFQITVPKYFKDVTISVRNNHNHIDMAQIFDSNGNTVTTQMLRQVAGSIFVLRVIERAFTHVIVEFDIGIEKIKANLSGESESLDYTMLSTIGNLTVILPPRISEIKSGDVIVAASRNLILKVVDFQRKQTADRRHLEWEVNTRVLQPSESLRNIKHGYRLY